MEHIHTDLLLTEENSDHIEFLEEEEEVEEDVVDCSWRREDVFADENSSMNENMIRKGLVSEVKIECIGETSTDECEDPDKVVKFRSRSVSRVSQRTQLETLGEVSLEYTQEENEEAEEAPIIEEIIFEKQLIKFASELHIAINKQSSTEDLELISSYFTFMKFARVFENEGSKIAPIQLRNHIYTCKSMSHKLHDSCYTNRARIYVTRNLFLYI